MSQSRLDEQNIWTVLDKLLLSVNNSRKGGRQKIVFNITEIFKYWETTLCCGFKKQTKYKNGLFYHIIFLNSLLKV